MNFSLFMQCGDHYESILYFERMCLKGQKKASSGSLRKLSALLGKYPYEHTLVKVSFMEPFSKLKTYF